MDSGAVSREPRGAKLTLLAPSLPKARQSQGIERPPEDGFRGP
jgi:hypothetical protein